MKKLFGNELCNTGRQIEFDIAKTICILGMVFVHCFEVLAAPGVEEGAAYYVMVIVLDALFGAATFMGSMGLGLAYSWKDNDDYAAAIIKRGLLIFLFGYLLGFCRYGLPDFLFLRNDPDFSIGDIIADIMMDDIMQFAGLALMLFGLLKKLKLSDMCIGIVAVLLSIVGSFVRLISFENMLLGEGVGLFIGAYDAYGTDNIGCFPIFNWFIIVVGGFLYGKLLMRCKNVHKYYSIALPISAVIIGVYLAIAIPNKLGMMNGNIFYYYHMTTFDAVICLIGMVFATSMYHFISLALSSKVKKVISRISSNINRIYCIHWVIIGFIDTIAIAKKFEGFSTGIVFIIGCIIFVVANILAEIYTRYRERKSLAKTN